MVIRLTLHWAFIERVDDARAACEARQRGVSVPFYQRAARVQRERWAHVAGKAGEGVSSGRSLIECDVCSALQRTYAARS